MADDNGRVPAGAAVLREDVTTAIREALFEELARVGYGRLSIEAVARRAGVGKTAVYRRWRSKLELVIDVVSDVARLRLPSPDTGSFAGDVAALLQVAGRALRHPLAAQIIPDLLAESARNPEIAQTLQTMLRENQRHLTEMIIKKAVGRGEIPADTDPDLCADLMFGAVYWRLTVARAPLRAQELSALAAAVTRALGGSVGAPAAPPSTPG